MTGLALFCFRLFEERQKIPQRETHNRIEVKKPQAHKTTAQEKTGKTEKKAEQKNKELASLPPLPREHLKIAILIDDIGQDMNVLQELLAIDAPLSFAVLPNQRHSAEAARMLHLQKRDILLHLPMEPYNYPEVKPGGGALLTSMSDEEIREQFKKDLGDIPYARGVNNHMGSRFTEDKEKLAVVMQELKKRGLYFVDSRTTGDSKAREVATNMGVPCRSRNIFIDNDQTYEASRENMIRILDDPRRSSGGILLMIGHPHPSTIMALRDAVPLLRARGVEIVPVSRTIGQ